jgi:glycosyltransferase involved in cell wall biosynthesis
MDQVRGEPALTVTAPAHNERDNVGPLVEEIEAVLDGTGIDYEILIVDDGSTDGTGEVLRGLLAGHPRLRALRMTDTPPGRGNGQSAAFHAAFRASRGKWIVSMDADRQNDPTDIPAMLRLREESGADLVQGDRTSSRKDGPWRRFSSWVGFVFRRMFVGDEVRDTGCSLRVIRREAALALPLQYRGMHRFIPVLTRRMRFKVVEMPVRHRPRTAGATKYGTWDRALAGLRDCFAVRWMAGRRCPVEAEPLEPEGRPGAGS